MAKLGVDVDGVLADFVAAYDKLIIEMTEEDRFPKDVEYRTSWLYAEALGYDPKAIDAVWKFGIKKSRDFWATLPLMPDALKEIEKLNELSLSGEHEVTFVTNRFGLSAKLQTELWLNAHGMVFPTVVLAGDKAAASKLLKLDIYIDDKMSNVNDVMAMVRANNLLTRVYLRESPWNAGLKADEGVKLTSGVAGMLWTEGL